MSRCFQQCFSLQCVLYALGSRVPPLLCVCGFSLFTLNIADEHRSIKAPKHKLHFSGILFLVVVTYRHSRCPRSGKTTCCHSIWAGSLSVAIVLTITSYCKTTAVSPRRWSAIPAAIPVVFPKHLAARQGGVSCTLLFNSLHTPHTPKKPKGHKHTHFFRPVLALRGRTDNWLTRAG